PTSVVATRRLAKPRPVQGKQVPLSGGPPRDRVAAQRDGHRKQNPAYGPATESPRNSGGFLFGSSAGATCGRPRALGSTVTHPSAPSARARDARTARTPPRFRYERPAKRR